MYRRKAPVSRRPVQRRAVRGYGAYDPAKGQGYQSKYKAMKKYGGGGRYQSQPKSFLSRVGKAVAPAIGTLAGSVMGGPGGALLGGALGSGLTKMVSSVFGLGDYKIQSNAMLQETNGPPRVLNRGKEFVIRHREYITDVYSAAGAANGVSPFNNVTYNINPGQFNCFPWLSQIAGKFEQYRIEGILFEYKSMYSDAVVTQNGALGNVILATEYNAGQPAFVNKQQMENYEFAQSCKPSLSVVHPVECARNQSVLTELYVRPGSVPQGEDIKTYDFGTFQIATVGVPLGAAGAAVNLGELWLSYQIVLLKPKIFTSGATYIDSGYSHNYGTIPSNGFGGGTFPYTGGTGYTPSTTSNLGLTMNSSSISIPLVSYPMLYYVTIKWRDTSNANTAGWNAGFVNGTVINGSVVPNTLNNGNYNQTPGGATTTTNGGVLDFVVQANQMITAGQNCTMNISPPQVPTGIANVRWDVVINALPTGAN